MLVSLDPRQLGVDRTFATRSIGSPRICRTLKTEGVVRDGTIVYHVTDESGVAGGYGDHVDYEHLAHELETERAEQASAADPADFDARVAGGGADWDPTWRGGDSWWRVSAKPVDDGDALDAAAEAAAQAAATRLRRRAADTAASLSGSADPAADIWASPRPAGAAAGRSAAGARSGSMDLVVPGRMSATQRGPSDDESAGRIIPAAKPAVPGRPRQAPSEEEAWGRSLHQVYECSARGCSFRLLHLLEGRWNGEAQVMLPAGAAGTMPAGLAARVCASSLEFDGRRGLWVESQRFTASDGTTVTQRLVLEPVQDGVCAVTVEGDPARGGAGAHFSHQTHMAGIAFAAGRSRRDKGGGPGRRGGTGFSDEGEGGEWESREVDLQLREVGPAMLLLTGTLRATGTPVLVETMTVVDNLRRARTVQRFDAGGKLQSVFAMRETRVIDAVTGAMATTSG